MRTGAQHIWPIAVCTFARTTEAHKQAYWHGGRHELCLVWQVWQVADGFRVSVRTISQTQALKHPINPIVLRVVT